MLLELVREFVLLLEPCPQGHGGTEGKRCAYFVDERYLASLGLMALEISSRIPNAAIACKALEISSRIPNAARGIYDSGVYLAESSKIIG